MDDLTPNAVIAWNVRRLLRERGWTQTELAERLGEQDDKPWTYSMVSDAETAGRTDRDRQFTVNEAGVLARVLQVSMIALFVPNATQLVRDRPGGLHPGRLHRPGSPAPTGDDARRVQAAPPEQYAVRNRESADRLARSRPARGFDSSSDVAQRLLLQIFDPGRGGFDVQR